MDRGTRSSLAALHRLQVELGDLIDLLQRLLGFGLDLFLGKLLVVELNDFLDRAGAVAQILADLEKLLEDQGRARDGLQHEQLAPLDALGNRNFTFAGKQGHRAHLAQIHADGIVGFFKRARSEIEVAVFRGSVVLHDNDFGGVGCVGSSERSLRARKIFIHIDPVALEGREQIVNFLRGVHLGRQDIVHLIVEQVAPLLAHGDELSNLVVFFFKSQRHASFPLIEPIGAPIGIPECKEGRE